MRTKLFLHFHACSVSVVLRQFIKAKQFSDNKKQVAYSRNNKPLEISAHSFATLQSWMWFPHSKQPPQKARRYSLDLFCEVFSWQRVLYRRITHSHLLQPILLIQLEIGRVNSRWQFTNASERRLKNWRYEIQ